MFKINDTPEALVIELSEKIDNQLSTEMERSIFDSIGNTNKKIVYNFDKTTFICSHFFKVLLKSYNAVGKNKFQIVNLSPEITRVFKIAGFDSILKQ